MEELNAKDYQRIMVHKEKMTNDDEFTKEYVKYEFSKKEKALNEELERRKVDRVRVHAKVA